MIRPYRPDDRARVVGLTVLAFDGVSIDQNIEARHGPIGGVDWRRRKALQIEADLDACPGGCFVAERDGVVAGVVVARADPRTHVGRVPSLAIHPDHQGHGLGPRLLQAAIDHLRAAGMKALRIETLEQNPRALRLYARFAFHEVARQIHLFLPLDD